MKLVINLDMDNGLCLPDNKIISFVKQAVRDFVEGGTHKELCVGNELFISAFRVEALEALETGLTNEIIFRDSRGDHAISKYGTVESVYSGRHYELSMDLIETLLTWKHNRK